MLHLSFTTAAYTGPIMTTRNWKLTIGFTLVLFLIFGYYAYGYLIEKPPGVLIKALTKTDPPPPLPAGDAAPFRAPEGFSATIFSRETPGARVITRDPRGKMLVSETSEGKVVALPDTDADGKADRTVVVLEGLKQPHGILVHCPNTVNASADQNTNQSGCLLYVAETGELKSYAYDAAAMKATYKETLTTFPSGDGHFTRTLWMHPDGKRLLISVGSSCNVCVEEDPHRATVLSYDLGTKKVAIVATGLRNTVFMTTDPVKGEVWGTDNGRDVIGDDIPPDEVNIIEEGKKYGWPVCYGDNVQDTDFDDKTYDENPCSDATTPQIKLQAHSAPLGLAFIPEEGWPAEMRNDLLIAYHGSWNRSEPTGYKVVRFDLDNARNKIGGPIDFLTGFLPSGTRDEDEAIGRPVGVLAEPGGVAYISDDRAGAIYRIQINEIP